MRFLVHGTLAALAAALLLTVNPPAPADTKEPTGLFNGKDLSGWVNVNCAPNTFRAEAGEIITNGTPTGFLRTAKQYENFTLSFEWKHTNVKDPGNSGLFVWGDALPAVGTGYTRGIEVQVLVNLEKEGQYTSHGDLFSIWGATCKPVRPHPKGAQRCLPSERRCKGGGEWNTYDVTGRDGTLTLAVNGKVVSEVKECKPRKGYLALESEGAECRFRNFKFAELPTSNPKPAEVATGDTGHKSLYTGVDLAGWKADAGAWKAGETLKCVKPADLVCATDMPSGELVFDWKLPAKGAGEYVMFAGEPYKAVGMAGEWHRATVARGSADVGQIKFPGVSGLELRNIFLKPNAK